MKILDKIVVKIENYVCIVTFIIMIFLTFANVVSRFLLHMSLSFTEEIVTGLFVIASLAGASVAVRNQSHLGLDFFIGFMPAKVRKVLSVAATVLAVSYTHLDWKGHSWFSPGRSGSPRPILSTVFS